MLGILSICEISEYRKSRIKKFLERRTLPNSSNALTVWGLLMVSTVKTMDIVPQLFRMKFITWETII